MKQYHHKINETSQKKGNPVSNKLEKDTKSMTSLISPNVFICSEPVYNSGYLILDRSFAYRDIASDFVRPLDILAGEIELRDCFSKSKASGSPLILRFENYDLAVLTNSKGKAGIWTGSIKTQASVCLSSPPNMLPEYYRTRIPSAANLYGRIIKSVHIKNDSHAHIILLTNDGKQWGYRFN